MHKKQKFLAATSLALTVAAFGCTTNRYPGNGEPMITTPGYGAANQAVTPGSSSGTEGNPPMASSYIGIAQPNTDALADAAAQQSFQGRVLGPVNPAGVQVSTYQQTGGAVIPPAMLVNPQSTVNPSVSSPNGDLAVTGGAGGGGGGGVVLPGAATVSGSSVSTGSAGVSSASASPLAVTGAPTVSGSTVRVTNGVVSGTTKGMSTTASTMAVTSSKAKGTTTSSSVRSVPVTSGLKIQQNSGGQIVVSNAATTVPSTKGSSTTATDKTSTSTTNSVKP